MPITIQQLGSSSVRSAASDTKDRFAHISFRIRQHKLGKHMRGPDDDGAFQMLLGGFNISF